MLLLAFLPSLALPGLQEPETREERVLALVRRVASEEHSTWYAQARFGPPDESHPLLGNGPVFAPRVPISCGNSDGGTFDADRARSLARELAGIYGLEPRGDVGIDAAGGRAVLDFLDRRAGIGAKLRGLSVARMSWPSPPEPAETDLDAAECADLLAAGLRLHVADVQLYRRYDGDEVTPLCGYLAGLVRFLNAWTPGEDVDPGAWIFEREATLAVPQDLASSPGLQLYRLSRGEGWQALEWIAEEPRRLVLSFRGLQDLGEPVRSRFLPDPEADEHALTRSTRGAPSVLLLPFYFRMRDGQGTGALPMRIVQELEGALLVHESPVSTAFLPSTFDLTRPFRVELELPIGRLDFRGAPRIGAPGR